MRTSAAWLLTGCVALGLGCGSSGSGAPLDCAWLAGNNCYKITVAAANACLPPATERGALDANNGTCTYASGAVVTFTPALTLPLPLGDDAKQWNFTVSKGGQTCLHYQENQGGFSLTVGSDTVSEGSTGGLGLKVTCPGGMSYSNGKCLRAAQLRRGRRRQFLRRAAWQHLVVLQHQRILRVDRHQRCVQHNGVRLHQVLTDVTP